MMCICLLPVWILRGRMRLLKEERNKKQDYKSKDLSIRREGLNILCAFFATKGTKYTKKKALLC